MNHRQRVGLAVGPLFLRIGLGITFVWAGLGKVMVEDMSVQGADAVVLADLGVILAPARPGVAPSPAPTNTPPTPVDPKPAGKSEGKPDSKPTLPGPSEPLPTPGEKPTKPSTEPAKPEPVKPEAPKTAPAKPESPKTEPKVIPKLAGESEIGSPVRSEWDAGVVFARTQAASRYTAADFAEPVRVRRVHYITLSLVKAANPGVDAEGKGRMALWPTWAAAGRWPVLFAWAAAVTELVGGAFVLQGFLTRFWSLGLVITMVVAAWLTHFGPAIQSGNTVWLVLPNQPRFSVEAWHVLLWQMMLAMSALSLFFAGPGALSLDRALFGRGPASGVVPTVS